MSTIRNNREKAACRKSTFFPISVGSGQVVSPDFTDSGGGWVCVRVCVGGGGGERGRRANKSPDVHAFRVVLSGLNQSDTQFIPCW